VGHHLTSPEYCLRLDEKRPHPRLYLRAASIILNLSFDLSARDDYTLLYPPLSSPEHTAPGTFWILIALHCIIGVGGAYELGPAQLGGTASLDEGSDWMRDMITISGLHIIIITSYLD
jgi:hypothetical protein